MFISNSHLTETGGGFEFENSIVGGVVPREYIPSVEQGLKDAMENGVLAGYPLIDVKANLFDGSYHDVDSSEMAFKIAASLALKAAKNVISYLRTNDESNYRNA